MNNRNFDAVVFDSDGTLMDSFAVYMTIWKRLAEHFQVDEIPLERIDRVCALGLPMKDVFEECFPAANVEDVFRANDRLIESSFLDIKPYTGVREMLAGLGSAGSKMALLTGSGANVKNLYEHHDIHNYFESVVHRERLTKQKPDPEGFYLAMKELGLAPDRSVMVGDSSNDMLAGRNAGAYRVVGVSYGGGTREELEKAGADYVVDSVAELSALLKAGDGPALEYCALRNTLPL